jgi:hypothetical protein
MKDHSVIGWVSLSLGIISTVLSLIANAAAYGFYGWVLSLIIGLIARFAFKDNFGVAGSGLGAAAVYLSLSLHVL